MDVTDDLAGAGPLERSIARAFPLGSFLSFEMARIAGTAGDERGGGAEEAEGSKGGCHERCDGEITLRIQSRQAV